jgi:predicted KAP-like P-loop ATPase
MHWVSRVASSPIGSDEYYAARACKQFLDLGRVHWLQQRGYQADTQEYVHQSVTRENRILLAIPQTEPHSSDSQASALIK